MVWKYPIRKFLVHSTANEFLFFTQIFKWFIWLRFQSHYPTQLQIIAFWICEKLYQSIKLIDSFKRNRLNWIGFSQTRTHCTVYWVKSFPALLISECAFCCFSILFIADEAQIIFYLIFFNTNNDWINWKKCDNSMKSIVQL